MCIIEKTPYNCHDKILSPHRCPYCQSYVFRTKVGQ